MPFSFFFSSDAKTDILGSNILCIKGVLDNVSIATLSFLTGRRRSAVSPANDDLVMKNLKFSNNFSLKPHVVWVNN
jgi:hypothetical protein